MLSLAIRGENVYDIYGKDRKDKEITIKLACYREVGMFLDKLRRKVEKTDYIDFTDYKALPMDPVNCFEKEQQDYSKVDAIIAAMHLTEIERAVLNCYMNGMVQSEVIAFLGIGRGSVNYRKAPIRQEYQRCFGCY